MNAFLQAALAAFFDYAKEAAMDKVKEEAKKIAEELGIKIDEWTDEMLADLAAKKEELDKETRRKVRAFWAPVGFIVGGVVGYLLAVML